MVTQATDVTVTCFSLLTLATQARALATLALSTHSLHLAGDAAERQPQLDAEHGGSRKPVLSSEAAAMVTTALTALTDRVLIVGSHALDEIRAFGDSQIAMRR